ncbi:mutator type transposase, partial [Tanacetum coccineum]
RESSLFSIKLHHGGVFTSSPNRKYKNGNITFVDMIEIDEFSVHEIDSMLEDLGHNSRRVMFYHFLKPSCDLDNGLEPLASVKDVVSLANYVTQGLKLVSVFVEHEKNSEGQSIGKNLEGQNSGKDKGQTSGKNFEGQSSAVGIAGSSQVPNQFVNDFYSSYDPYEESQDLNFDPFADLDLILPQAGNRECNTSHAVDLKENVETEGQEDIQDEEDIEDEEERKDEDEIQGEEETESEDETDSQDSDYLVDEDNNVDDVDVDSEDFECNIDEEVEFIGCREQPTDIAEEGDAEEIEVLDNDYFESASDSDDEGSRLRKRKLKQIRKQAHASEQIYKTYFYVGKEFPNKEEVKSYIKEHSIETGREIRMEKNDNERVRAVCKGVIPSLPAFEDNGPSQGSGPTEANGPSQGQFSGSIEKWTKEKIARSNGYRSPSKDKLTKEKLINGVVVNVETRTCTCRRWELTGIPCNHVVATNWVMSLNNEATIPEKWVHPCYRLETWRKVYSFKIKPIRGRIHWPKCNVPTTLLPPKHQPQVGRPPKERKKSAAERDVLKTVTCGKCNTKGHNSRSCTGPRVPQSNKRKVPTKGMDLDTNAPIKKTATTQAARFVRATTQAARSARAPDKGKAPTTNDGAPKKTATRKAAPRKNVINLDDFIVLCNGDIHSVKIIKNALEEFSSISGLNTHLH